MRSSLGLCSTIMGERIILAVATIAVLLPGSIYAQSKKKSKVPALPDYVEAKFRVDAPQGIKESLQKSELRRRAEFDALVKDFEEVARALKLLESNQVRLPRGETNMYFNATRNKAARTAEITSLRELLAKREFELESVGGNPAFVCLAKPNHGMRVGEDGMLYLEKLETGVICRFPAAAVISVAGPEDMLVGVNVASDERVLQNIWLSGFSTAGLIDNAGFCPEGPVLFSGTKAYTSAGGASRTVLKAVPFDPSEYIEGVNKKSDAAETARKFTGRWKIVNDKGVIGAYFTLDRAFTAKKSHVPDATGKWEIVGDEARITWSDGWKDILRPEKDRILKIAFGPGTTWTDKPADMARAIKE